MGKLRNLKIGTKLSLSFLVVIVLFVIALSAAMIGMNFVSSSMSGFYTEEFQIVKTSQTMKTNLQGVAKGLARMVLSTDESSQAGALESTSLAARESEMRQYLTNLETQMDELDGYALQTDAERDAIKEKFAQLNAVIDQICVACERGDAATADSLVNNELEIRGYDMGDSLNALIDRANERAETTYENVRSLANAVLILSTVLAVVVVILAIVLCVFLTRSITHPLKEMEGAAKRLAEGDLSQEITYESDDELGSLARDLRTVLASMKLYIGEIDRCLDSLGRGKLNATSNVEFKGDFVSIKVALDNISERLTHAMIQINTSADQVMSGAEQIAGSGQALSQATLEQASSVEELSATINEISDHVLQNAENAISASEYAEGVGTEVTALSRQMHELGAAMAEMKAMSKKITGIIGDIEDIAFQTNILSLNAAVEAARAGDAGKGFSVVANEIRRLSGQTTEASHSTSELIGQAVDMMVQGAALADAASAQLLDVSESASNALTKVEHISRASNEQATSVVQLRESIDQIADVVQENSATAEESAAASEELTEQMKMLKQLVDSFEYDD